MFLVDDSTDFDCSSALWYSDSINSSIKSEPNRMVKGPSVHSSFIQCIVWVTYKNIVSYKKKGAWVMGECVYTPHLYDNLHLGTEELCQSLNHLLCKIKDLSSGPQCPYKKLSMRIHGYNSSTEETSRWIPGAHWTTSLAKSSSSRFNERSCLKNVGGRWLRQLT